MTEKEAEGMWCPFVRLMGVHGVWNRREAIYFKEAARAGGSEYDYYREQEEACKCIASGCMAWRWVENAQMVAIRGPQHPPPPGEGWVKEDLGGARGDVRYSKERPNREGCCGLAGRPEFD